MRALAFAALIVPCLTSLVACGSDSGPSTPGGAVDGAKFSQIFPLIFPTTTNARCSFCHGLPANEISNGKLHMGADVATAYTALVDQASASNSCNGRELVVPGHPEESLFLLKLSPAPPCGNRMPVGGAVLPDAQLEMIRTWIAAGAKND